MKHKQCRNCKLWDDCVCHLVDPALRLSFDAQVAAILDAESYVWRFKNEDPADGWIDYLERVGKV